MQLLRSTQKKVSTSHNLRDAHQRIINHNCQLISPSSIFSPQNIVATMFCQVHLLLAIMTVLKRDDLVRNHKSCGMRRVLRHFIEFFAPASASINDAAIRFVRRLSGHDVGPGTEARVGETCIL